VRPLSVAGLKQLIVFAKHEIKRKQQQEKEAP
jgi:hypothetical protein